MEEKKSARAILHGLKIGEEFEFPAERFRSVRSLCSDYGFEWNRKFSVRKDWDNNKTIVKREK